MNCLLSSALTHLSSVDVIVYLCSSLVIACCTTKIFQSAWRGTATDYNNFGVDSELVRLIVSGLYAPIVVSLAVQRRLWVIRFALMNSNSHEKLFFLFLLKFYVSRSPQNVCETEKRRVYVKNCTTISRLTWNRSTDIFETLNDNSTDSARVEIFRWLYEMSWLGKYRRTKRRRYRSIRTTRRRTDDCQKLGSVCTAR